MGALNALLGITFIWGVFHTIHYLYNKYWIHFINRLRHTSPILFNSNANNSLSNPHFNFTGNNTNAGNHGGGVNVGNDKPGVTISPFYVKYYTRELNQLFHDLGMSYPRFFHVWFMLGSFFGLFAMASSVLLLLWSVDCL